MTETCVQEKVKTKTGRNAKGQWVKGFCPNFKGNTSKLDVKDLVLALNEEAERRKYPNFLAYAAQRAFINDQVLIAIMKKIFPDKTEQSGEVILTVKDKNARADRLRAYYGGQVQN